MMKEEMPWYQYVFAKAREREMAKTPRRVLLVELRQGFFCLKGAKIWWRSFVSASLLRQEM